MILASGIDLTDLSEGSDWQAAKLDHEAWAALMDECRAEEAALPLSDS